MTTYDVVVVGGGPAGMTAAIYSAKRELKTLLLEKTALGGYMLLAKDIENYPGFLHISGVELSKRMEEQVRNLPVDVVFAEALRLEFSDNLKKIVTSEGVFQGKAVILAVGGGHKKLEVKGEKEYTGRGVSYCATCDAPFYRNKVVAVVGGGNSAIQDALILSDVARKVYLIHRKDALRAEEARQKELNNRGVEVLLNKKVEEISGEGVVNGLRVKDLKTGCEEFLKVDGVFISIGTVPHSEIARDAGILLDDKNFIKVDRNQETNIKGVYAAGDVTGGVMQICTACGEGCIAALNAYKYVKKPYWS